MINHDDPYYICHSSRFRFWIYRIYKTGKIDRREQTCYDPYYKEMQHYEQLSVEQLKTYVENGDYTIISKQEANNICRSWKTTEYATHL